MKHYTIPFFIPHKGCPNQCIFCDQKKITGMPDVKAESIPLKIEKYLGTIGGRESFVEVGFFGGSFTALDPGYQESLLAPVQSYVKKGMIKGIRLSTRPDCISNDILDLLYKMRVTAIELGVQSMNDDVLMASGRGHTAVDTENASRLILGKGFKLVHQIMLGLPRSEEEDEYYTARRVRDLGAAEARIYPVVVVRGTGLSEKWHAHRYIPLGEKEAVTRASRIMLFFSVNGVKVIRCGLHPSENMLNGTDLEAGPFHPAFALKCESRIFGHMLVYIFSEFREKVLALTYNPKDQGAFFGFGKENIGFTRGPSGKDKCSCRADENVLRGSICVDTGSGFIPVTRSVIVPEALPDILKRDK